MTTNLELISIFIALISVLVSIAAVVATLRSRSRKTQLQIKEELKPDKQIGLVLLIGPSKGSAPAAIEFHLPILQYCWLIGTKESLGTVQQLIKTYETVNFFWGGDYSVDPDEIRSTYNAISQIFESDIPKLGVQISSIIADITGGLKPMSAAISIACVNYQCKMQFMKAPRDENGAVINGGISEPVKVDIAFETITK